MLVLQRRGSDLSVMRRRDKRAFPLSRRRRHFGSWRREAGWTWGAGAKTRSSGQGFRDAERSKGREARGKRLEESRDSAATGGLAARAAKGKRRLQLRELAVANAAREGGQGREARRELARTRERLGDLALVDHDEVGEGLA